MQVMQAAGEAVAENAPDDPSCKTTYFDGS
jgi:hypothetical protein